MNILSNSSFLFYSSLLAELNLLSSSKLSLRIFPLWALCPDFFDFPMNSLLSFTNRVGVSHPILSSWQKYDLSEVLSESLKFNMSS